MSFKIKKIKPMFDGVVTTAKRYVGDQFAEHSSGLIIDTTRRDGQLNVYQTVIAAGEIAERQGIKEGAIVLLNFDRYLEVKHVDGRITSDNVQTDKLSASYAIPMVNLDGQDCLFVHGNDVVYVVEDYEVDEGGLLQ